MQGPIVVISFHVFSTKPTGLSDCSNRRMTHALLILTLDYDKAYSVLQSITCGSGDLLLWIDNFVSI